MLLTIEPAINSDAFEPQSSAGTFEGNYIDRLSNGFKLRSTGANSNASETYIYCAWAEAPSIDLYGGVPMPANINN